MLLDTSGLFSFHHKDEPQHAEAVRLFHTASVLLTHNYVLAELVALAQARRLPRVPLLDFIAELFGNPLVETVFVDPELHQAGLDLLRQRADKGWSLCDAVSFVLMGERGMTESLTADHHFEQAGFVRLLQP